MGEEGAAMGILDRLFMRRIQTCGSVSVKKIREDQERIRGRLDHVRATLDGEEGWFLSLRKEDQGGSEDVHRNGI